MDPPRSTSSSRSRSTIEQDPEASAKMMMIRTGPEEARAGKDGYSLSRQPLSRLHWDPQHDPPLDATTTSTSTTASSVQQQPLRYIPEDTIFDDDDHDNNRGRTKGTTTTMSQDSTWWLEKQKRQSTTTTFSSSSSSSSSQSISASTLNGSSERDDVSVPSSSSSTLSLSSSLDLFQRSLDTLDFPYVLNALREECWTTPAKRMVQMAMYYKSWKMMIHSTMSTKPKSTPITATTMDTQRTWAESNPSNDPTRDDNHDDHHRLTQPIWANRPLLADSVGGIQDRYQAVQEMEWLLSDTIDLGKYAEYKNRRGYTVTLGRGTPPPLEGLSFDLDSILTIVTDQGQVLEGPELLELSCMLEAMEDLQRWSQQGLQRVTEDPSVPYEFVQLPQIIADIQINATLQTLLADALDVKGRLSGTTFPVLGRLRSKIRNLKADILQTLDNLVQMPSIKNKLALESGGPLYSEVANGGRLVLPIDPKYASSIGIVHDSSRSGKTVYVEPSEIVGPTNELRQTEAELKAEEARVWRFLTEQVLRNRLDLEQSVRAVAQLDLVMARCMLGQKLQGVIPVVEEEGVICLQNAKHPVLLLRQISNVVGSDIELGANGNQGLVLTGPNSGGKTVILKLLGLLALLSRSGIPVPAAPPKPSEENNGEFYYQPRVDFFDPVLADIGDIQSVGGDLSTFSGHMLVCREVLANSGQNALVLMDELGSGTDPAQGVAIAQAILEALVECGCRVAITTHYMELKQLAASDPRFAVAGMQFVKGRPTYKLLPGTVGESFAMAVAERLQLPQSVIDRANELLDSETRQMGDLIRELEDQKALVEDQVAELEAKKKELAQIEYKMKEEQIKLERKMLSARRDEAKKFAKKLEEKEQILEDILEKLKSDPSRKLLAKSWDDIKFVKRDALNEAENVPSVLRAKMEAAMAQEEAQAELIPLAEMREKPDLQPGDKLLMCKPGPLFGKEALVQKCLGRRLEVTVSGMPMSVNLADVSMYTSTLIPQQTSKKSSFIGERKADLSRAAEKALMKERNAPLQGYEKAADSGSSSKTGSTLNMRTESNTVDVRGCNLEEAKNKVKSKFSQCLMSNRKIVFILHGHGTGGVLKSKLRGWLGTERQLVKRWSPAEQSDGGDAFTRVEL